MELTPVSPSRRFMAWALEIVLFPDKTFINYKVNAGKA